MKKVIIAAILVLGLLLIPMPVSAAPGVSIVDKTGDGTWVGTTWQVGIFPNEVKSTILTLYNSSSSTLEVEVSTIPDLLDGGNLTFELSKANFTMPGKSYSDVTLTVKASGSTTPGTYNIELEVKSEIPPSFVSGNGGGVSGLKMYSLKVENITENSTDIVWETSRSASSRVTYWASPKIIIEDEVRVQEHRVHLKDLASDTTYTFEVYSRDIYGKTTGKEGVFTTLAIELEEELPIVEEPIPVPPIVVEPEVLVPPEPEGPVGPTEPEPEPPKREPIIPEPSKLSGWTIVGVVAGSLIFGGGVG